MSNEFWQIGALLNTRTVQMMSEQHREQLRERERREVYRNFSADDNGCSREHVAEFLTAEDAKRCVRAINLTTWRTIDPDVYIGPMVVNRLMIIFNVRMFPLQIWHEGWLTPMIAHGVSDIFYEKPSHWAPILPLPNL